MISVREATPEDVAQMHQMINELAEYEKAPEEVIATEPDLMKALFGRDFSSAEYDQHDSIAPAGIANTPHGQPALYAYVVEDPEDSEQLAGVRSECEPRRQQDGVHRHSQGGAQACAGRLEYRGRRKQISQASAERARAEDDFA